MKTNDLSTARTIETRDEAPEKSWWVEDAAKYLNLDVAFIGEGDTVGDACTLPSPHLQV
jgi:hypothetical protein